MIKKTLFACAALLCQFSAQAANATEVADRVVAVVNDAIITQVDLSNRLSLLQRGMKSPLTGKNYYIFRQRVLNTLLEEELIRQYAAENDIRVDEEEFTGMLAFVEQKNGIEKGKFEEAFGDQTTTAISQLKNDMLRQKIIQRYVRPRISIAPEEIDTMLENISSAQDKVLERRLQHIFIEIDEDEPTKAADKVKQAYRALASGEDFSIVAQTFSDNTSVSTDKGDLGWSTPGELSNELEAAVSGLEKDDITQPVKASGGWHILKVTDVRRPQLPSFEQIEEVDIYQIRLVKSEQNKDLQEDFEDLTEDLETKSDFQELIRKLGKNENYQGTSYVGYIALNALPKAVAAALEKLKPGSVSAVIEDDKALTKVYIANKKKRTPKAVEQYRNKLKERMLANRMERLSQRFFRNLRRKAYIDVRL